MQYHNQLKYAWSHTAINTHAYPFATPAANGWYTYEFSRPLNSPENTDVKFQIGKTSNFSVAFWTPSGDEEWDDANHFVAPATFRFATVEFMNEQQPNIEQSSENNGSTIKSMTASIVFVVVVIMIII